MADPQDGWWLLECGHYGHYPDDRYLSANFQLTCRTCKRLNATPSCRRPVKHLMDEYVIQEI